MEVFLDKGHFFFILRVSLTVKYTTEGTETQRNSAKFILILFGSHCGLIIIIYVFMSLFLKFSTIYLFNLM